MRSRFVAFLLCFFCYIAQASEHPQFDRVLLAELANDPLWIKLVHYEPDSSSESGFTGAIKSQAFYLSNNGRFSPLSELIETLSSFYKEERQANSHAQCQFPARYLWFKQHFVGRIELPKPIECPAFNAWSDNGSFQSISVIYVTGYLGNPASFYGHTFLKFNTGDKQSYSLDKTINYGAVVPDAENPITYIYKGIVGGYEGGFSEVGYYFHQNNYGDNELRDMWEYELNISAQDTALISAHAWETLKKEYTYFFFKKNCAYRMAELVELASGVNILNSKPVTIPQSLITSIYEASVNGQPLVKSVQYRPSRQSALYEKYTALSLNEKAQVHQLVGNPEQLTGEGYQSRSTASKQKIIDTLLDYLQYARTPDERANNIVSPFYRNILLERYRLPIANGVPESQQAGSPPHEGRSPSLVQFGAVHNSVKGEGVVFALRPAYYDVLDADKSHVADSVLSMASIELFVQDDSLSLRRLSLIDLESVNAAVTGLPHDNGNSWKLQVELAPLDLSCEDCLTLKAKAFYGYAKRASPSLLVGGYVGGILQDNVNKNGNIGVGGRVFTNIAISTKYTANIFAESLTPLDIDAHSYYKYGAELRMKTSKETDLRFSYHKDQAQELSIKVGFYF